MVQRNSLPFWLKLGRTTFCFSRRGISPSLIMQSWALPWQRPGLMGFVLGGQPLLPTPMIHLQQTAFAQGKASAKAPTLGAPQASEDKEVGEGVAETTVKPRARLAQLRRQYPRRRCEPTKTKTKRKGGRSSSKAGRKLWQGCQKLRRRELLWPVLMSFLTRSCV